MIPGLSGVEFVAIAIVAILIIPPKELPKVASHAGRMWVKLKYQLANIRTQVDRAIAEAELEEIKEASQNISSHLEPLKDVKSAAKNYVNKAIAAEGLDIAKDVKDVEETLENIKEETEAQTQKIEDA